ncbi:MAG: hypothetical protein ABI378_06960 [Chitinophagaceae bacterium]
MICISNAQINLLNSIPLEIFLKKVARFIREQIPEEAAHYTHLELFVREQYVAAKKAGCRTEREIVQFILDKVFYKTR